MTPWVPAASTGYRVLWKVLLVATDGLTQWVSVRAGTEAEAMALARAERPAWRVASDAHGNPCVSRERNP